jgi:HTH-type transcriptional regulator/antitoxin HigA
MASDTRATYSAASPESDWAIHPGELLGEELEVRGMTQKALAETLGRPPQAINEIIRGKKAITADTAVGLEAALGTPAYLWLRLQARYELVLARERAVEAPRSRERASLRGVAEE